ncbi:hypothetical protein GGI07_005757 [Coemansia sp. Benny D115]|nr:hypothetical protein GGI07_005757 [Coemansia sp. Benny D115]
MAPILLKIKGTKLFSPFNEIEDVNDLSTLWRVCTKVKDSLENGSRLENLSWRLWHLHQTLEARGKGRDLRRLSPATTKQLEKTIRRPGAPNGSADSAVGASAAAAAAAAAAVAVAGQSARKAKPMQIKVRLGKSSGERPEAEAAHPEARRRGSSSAQNRPERIASPLPQQQQQQVEKQRDVGPPGELGMAAESNTLSEMPSEQGTSAMSALVSASASASATEDMASSAAAGDAEHPAAVAALTSLAADTAVAPVAATASTAAPETAAAIGSTVAGAAEEVQASDFMSFGPSTFLSSGFDLDAPQIEITLDDIFSANSSDWSQFGFGALAGGAPLGMTAALGGYGASPAMWANGGYPGPMGAAGFPAAHLAGEAAQQQRRHEGPICDNCGVTSTPLWRRSADDTVLCNACGLYYKLHNTHRPKSLRSNNARKDGGEDEGPKTVCTNCATTNTPLWRRDEKNNPLCNACGLYYKLHKENRPIKLKTDIIRKRQRYDSSATTAPRKRPSGAQKTLGTKSPPSASSESPAPQPGTKSPRSRKSRGSRPALIPLPGPPAQPPAPPPLQTSILPQTTSSVQPQSQPQPMSAPPVSYSANGTQLLNSADTASPALQSLAPPASASTAYEQSPHIFAQGRGYVSYASPNEPPPSQRRHTTASELAAIPVHHHAFGSDGLATHGQTQTQGSVPLPLQASATQPVQSRMHYETATSHHSQQQQQQQRSVGAAAINIPMSPPLSARADPFYARTAQPMSQLPPLSLAQTNSGSGRHSAASPSSSSGTGRHSACSPLHLPQLPTDNRTYVSGRQLPSLAELASSASPAPVHLQDNYRYAHHPPHLAAPQSTRSPQPQPSYPSVNN